MEVHCHQRRPWRWRSIVIKEDPGDGGPLSSKKTLAMEAIVIKEDPGDGGGDGGHCHQRRPW